MNRRDNTPAWVMHEHGDTIRRAHGYRHAWLIRHQRIPPTGKLIRLREWTIYDQGLSPMYLLDGQQPAAPLRTRLTSGNSDIELQ